MCVWVCVCVCGHVVWLKYAHVFQTPVIYRQKCSCPFLRKLAVRSLAALVSSNKLHGTIFQKTVIFNPQSIEITKLIADLPNYSFCISDGRRFSKRSRDFVTLPLNPYPANVENMVSS